MKHAVTFYSEGCKLSGDLYLPEGLRPAERRAGIVLCHGYTGVKDLYLPDNARVLNEAGYVALAFDYKGWETSEGPTQPSGALRTGSRRSGGSHLPWPATAGKSGSLGNLRHQLRRRNRRLGRCCRP